VRKAWLVGVWLAVGAIGAGCSGDTDTGDDDDDDTDTVDTDDTDTTPECTGPENGSGPDRIEKILCLEGDLVAGELFYQMQCQACHLADGTGIDGGGTGANLTLSPLDEAGVVATVLQGIAGSDMDAYHVFPSQDLANVTTHVWENFVGN